MKKISILGSTGSIGRQALEVCDIQGNIEITALCAYSNIALLEKQIRKYLPRIAVLMDKQAAAELKTKVADLPVKVMEGMEGFCYAASMPEADMVLTAVVGVCGLLPTIKAIEAGKDIALANKETLVAGGSIVTALAKKNKVAILPVDSEHSAVFQCMQHQVTAEKILLTASGGPFFGYTKQMLEKVSIADALRHPNWTMGNKITIDSASLMNKGLEVIEACHLFDVDISRIEVVVHRQSMIHSMVQFADHSVLAQLSKPDMKLPIGYAFSYPERAYAGTEQIDFATIGSLTFEKPDMEVFPCLSLAYEAGKQGGTMPAVLNGANEAAVELFLGGHMKFCQIPEFIEYAMDAHHSIKIPTLEDILESDRQARELVTKRFQERLGG